MKQSSRNSMLLFFLGLLTLILFVVNVALGSVAIPIDDLVQVLLGQSHHATWNYLVFDYRMPKAITAILVGSSLSVAGLVMQTLFRNPMAGPYVLGLSSGASLGVALLYMGVGFLFPTVIFESTSVAVILVSVAGSLLVMLLVIMVSYQLRDTLSILIVGLMFGSFASAIISSLTYFSTAEQLQKFSFWSLGSLGNLSWQSIQILTLTNLIGLLVCLLCVKPLNSLLMGENFAISVGVNFKQVKLVLIIATSILVGSCTAFAGPIAFIGIAVPHITKLIFKTANHHILFWGCILVGASFLLLSDCIAQLPNSDNILPINAVTSLIGAPIVIFLVLYKPFNNHL
jgi:iron complex transport system permease protein